MVIVSSLGQPAFGQAYFGATDCGKWISEKHATDRGWLLGYMSGLNFMFKVSGGKTDPLNTVDSASQIFIWMDNYCQKNPLSKVTKGGNDLFIELTVQSK